MSFFENEIIAEGWPLASSPRLFEDDLLPFEEKVPFQLVENDTGSSLLDAGVNKTEEFPSLGNSWLADENLDVGLLESLIGLTSNEQSLPVASEEQNIELLESLAIPDGSLLGMDPQVQKIALELAETLNESLKTDANLFDCGLTTGNDFDLIDVTPCESGYVSSASPAPPTEGEYILMDALASPSSSDEISSLWSTPSSPFSVTETDNESSPASKPERPKPYSRPSETVPVPGSSRPTGRRALGDRKERKKLQNKNAATRYRQKKKEENTLIDGEIDQLERTNRELKEKEDQMKREIDYLKKLMSDVYKARGLVK